MPFVLDVSITASWFVRDVPHPHVELARRRIQAEAAAAPTIWWYEARNFLLMAERRKRLTSSEVDEGFERLPRLPVRLEVPNPNVSLSIARRHGLTFYDATYVERHCAWDWNWRHEMTR